MVQAWPAPRRARSPDRAPTGLRKPAMIACLRIGTLSLVCSALLLGASRERLNQSFADEIQPLLATYCLRCHGPQLQTAEIDFSVFDDHGSVIRSRPVWLRALRVLRENEMPPEGAQPTVEERQRMVAWIDDAVNHLDWSEYRQPGSVTIPRLNRDEYNNTIRDLTGLDLRPGDAFPADGQGESGFRNDRDGLFVAPVLAAKYLQAAGLVVEELIATRAEKDPLSVRLEIEDFFRTETNHEFTSYGLDLRNYQQTVYRYVTFPRFGRYRFRVRAWGESPVAGQLPGVTLRVGGRMVGQSHVAAEPQSPVIYEFEANIPRGSHRVSLHWFKSETALTNEHNRRLAAEHELARKLAKAEEKKPPAAPVLLSLDWVEVAEALEAGQDGSLVWIAEPGAGLDGRQAARRILEDFAERAYRRSIGAAEVEPLLAFYDRAAGRGEAFEHSVGLALRAALVSPRFLFRAESGGTSPADHRLDDYELASRLSYFLWMSMPDAELLELARTGSLGNEHVLARQVARMIADPKSEAFIATFFGQWLGFAELGDTLKPDDVAFPEFTPALGQAMVQEATSFFGRIVREDRSLLEILDSGYSYLNEDLAEHYGLTGIVGREQRLVEFDEERRGGVLGMGAILTATSLPTRTSPVVRGKWVLETMLGEQLPPPPPDAGELAEPGESSAGMTMRQMYEMHRDEQRCAACHDEIDPIGFGLENFDAIGRWRDTDNGQPIDATGTLPSGESFAGPVELKRILLRRSEEFAKMISEQMLGFALGRNLEYYDQPTVEEISRAVIRSEYSAHALINEIVGSYPFRFRRGVGDRPEESE